MRAVVQRVASACVTINGGETRSIGPGLVVFLGVLKGDGEAQVQFLAGKIAGLRVFSDAEGKMNLSLNDIGGQLLVISNFTLGSDCKKGRRPSFDLAAPPQLGEALYRLFVEEVRALGVPVSTGEFGAEMRVLVENDGPVTLVIDTETLGK
ncbi:D-tyrosyl-tRNA(Tyr) deacylase [Acutalibacter sp. 1XD8-33]|uniref:D-aminoacyl-tRNA deacylase n=1 Tax=Acutalibacter sp. 1XD8-33 TaxID=2320081 RepID=UPI000EA2117F|nr:D-aminoacyl-tRNA deacylase [Acutalibacter sp. 1XD8-33]RKJ42039.1 D-tyrosyl-tRNA(Tyr) deacylase [Acutalibacter sp. 1XD8-33]